MVGQLRTYLGDGYHTQHVGDIGLVVDQGKGVLVDGRLPFVIRLEFENGDLWWVADYDTEEV